MLLKFFLSCLCIKYIQFFVNYNVGNIYKYLSYKNILVIQIENVLNLNTVVSFGSVPWVTTIDRLDCTCIRIFLILTWTCFVDAGVLYLYRKRVLCGYAKLGYPAWLLREFCKWKYFHKTQLLIKNEIINAFYLGKHWYMYWVNKYYWIEL